MFSELFANNLLVKLLRGDTARYDLIVSMVGVKLGERLLLIGGGDGQWLAALGAKTGLTGTVAAVEPDEASASRVLEDATKAGVLADVETATPDSRGTVALPYQPASFDIVVIPFPADEAAALAPRIAEAFRVLRDGGRATVIARAGRGPDARRTSAERRETNGANAAPGASGATPPIVTALQQQGFRAARLLAERSGLLFYEAVKK
jgi:ubiquinone/menaquinone biosynthesis C-methylase UbiE